MQRPEPRSTNNDTPRHPSTFWSAGMTTSRTCAIPASMDDGCASIVVERAYTQTTLSRVDCLGAAPRWRHRFHSPPSSGGLPMAMGKPLRLFFNWHKEIPADTQSLGSAGLRPFLDQTSSGARRWASRSSNSLSSSSSAPASADLRVLEGRSPALCCDSSPRGCRMTHRTRRVRMRGPPAGWRCRTPRVPRARAERTSCKTRCPGQVDLGGSLHPRRPRAGALT